MDMRAKSALSLRSLQTKSRTQLSSKSPSREGLTMNFDDFVHWALTQFGSPVSVVVRKEIPTRDIVDKSQIKHQTKFRRKSLAPMVCDGKSNRPSFEESQQVHPHTLLVTAHFDLFNRMTDISMTRFHYQVVPRVLMQIIILAVPHYKYLTKFTITNCRIDVSTVYELSKLLDISNITEICLDHSPLEQGNFDILLNYNSSLRTLSLARCNINDVICERMAEKLCYPQPAERTLCTLNLSSNSISCKGAMALAHALRSNRHLRYLNLSDNHIEDKGACSILNMLKEFKITPDEIQAKQRRYSKYLREKLIIYNRCMEQLQALSSEDDTISVKKTKKIIKKHKLIVKRDGGLSTSDLPSKHLSNISLKKNMSNILTAKAVLLAEELLGAFKDPFVADLTKSIDNELHSIGNFTLCYINFAYNNLTIRSIQTLRDVVLYQEKLKNDKLCGLIKVVLEGNYVPNECEDLETINYIFKAHVEKLSYRSVFVRRRTTKASINPNMY